MGRVTNNFVGTHQCTARIIRRKNGGPMIILTQEAQTLRNRNTLVVENSSFKVLSMHITTVILVVSTSSKKPLSLSRNSIMINKQQEQGYFSQ